MLVLDELVTAWPSRDPGKKAEVLEGVEAPTSSTLATTNPTRTMP